MSYKLLKYIISHLKKTSKCPFCKGSFIDDTIFVLATSTGSDSSCQGLFFIMCPRCSSHAFVMVNVSPTQEIHVTTKPASATISLNEVLDMHNFLKQWQGDVKELFSEL